MGELFYHNIPPVYDCRSRVLILGSFPSVRSRGEGFFYAHPRNRFWIVMARLFNSEPPVTTDLKRQLLLRNRVALWDVAASCRVRGSGDVSITDVVPNDITPLMERCGIRTVFANGRAAHSLYRRYIYPRSGVDAVYLPSTSPANASFSLEELVRAWAPVAAAALDGGLPDTRSPAPQ